MIHPTALVSEDAELGDGVEIGPLCVVGEGVRLGAGTRLIASSVVLGPTMMGEGNEVHPFAVLGGAPQDRSYAGEATTLVVGDRNVFREHVTVHRGTTKDRGETRIGHGGLFMASSHVAHDCEVGDGVTLANGALLGGHARIGDGVVLGGQAMVAPFVRIGRLAFLAGGAGVETDIPPFVIAAGDRARVRVLNRVGLERAGVSRSAMAALEQAFRLLFRSNRTRAEALHELSQSMARSIDAAEGEVVAEVRELAEFLLKRTTR